MRKLILTALCAAVVLALPAASSAGGVGGCPSTFTLLDWSFGAGTGPDKNGDGKYCRRDLPEQARYNAIGIDNTIPA